MALRHSLSLLLALTMVVLCSAEYEYDNGGSTTDLIPHYQLNPKPKEELENLLSTIIGIQGTVYCKSGSAKPFPLEGAVVRITCLAVDKHGYERSPFSFLSDATNENGYFFATLSPSEIPDQRKITKCKAFLELSPMETCNIPTNINQGTSGYVLSSYHLLEEKKMKLYTVKPLFYTSEPQKTVPNGGY